VSTSTLWVTYGKTYNNLPTPTRNGYTFDGWYTAQSGGTKITSSTTVNLTGNQTLYAHWTAIPSKANTETTPTQVNSEPSQYTVVLDDGSTCSRITVTNGGTYAGLPTPSKDGYTFDGWYTSASGGTKIIASTVVALTGDQTLYAHWTKKSVEWGPWSEWSSTPVTASSTRQVETKQVKVSDAYTEYRYGRYVDSTRTHDCWCKKYLEGLSYVSGSATLQYSSWSTTQYSTSGKSWSCGNCSAVHTGVDHTSSDGRSWWSEYLLPDGSYYWKESRQVDATYQTLYRYRTVIG
jgi:uncharacterized repeat protein (TIGR02543 family)